MPRTGFTFVENAIFSEVVAEELRLIENGNNVKDSFAGNYCQHRREELDLNRCINPYQYSEGGN